MAAAHVLISGHHASSHQASEFLQDRLPNSQTSFALKADEVAVAYGQRAMPKLVEVLSLPDKSDACSIECLQLLLSLLGNQERKAQAISAKLVQCVAPFLGFENCDICNLSCQVLASLAQLFQGRLAILQASGLEAVIAALGKAPESGIICLQAFSVSIDGSAALLDCSENASEALVHSLQQSVPGPHCSAAVAALQCLANLTRTRQGVSAALQAQLPSCLVTFVNQAAGAIPMLATLCDLDQWSLDVVRYASAALASIAVGPDVKLETYEAAGSALMVLLKCKDSAAAGNAKLAICNTADHPKARIELQKVMKEEAAEYLKGLPDLPPDYRYHVPKAAMMYISPKNV
ncbi:TPA: 50S ribosomal protein L3 [Trebouxia sp. C0004]